MSDSESDRERRECRSYGAGHNPHHIQVFKAMRNPESYREATLVEVTDTFIDLAFEHGEPIRLWTHDTERVDRLAAEPGSRVGYHSRWSLVVVHAPDGETAAQVSVAREADFGPCSPVQKGGIVMRPGPDQSDEEIVDAIVKAVAGDE